MGRPKKSTMTLTEATELAKRIINTWRGGPPLTEWTDVLLELDAGTAGTAFIRLRNDTDHTPTIARYLAIYRSLHTPANDPINQPDCPDCGRTGWARSARPDHAGNPCVTPCGCPAGRHAEIVHQKIDDHRRTHRQGPYAHAYQAPEHTPLTTVTSLFKHDEDF